MLMVHAMLLELLLSTLAICTMSMLAICPLVVLSASTAASTDVAASMLLGAASLHGMLPSIT